MAQRACQILSEQSYLPQLKQTNIASALLHLVYHFPGFCPSDRYTKWLLDLLDVDSKLNTLTRIQRFRIIQLIQCYKLIAKSGTPILPSEVERKRVELLSQFTPFYEQLKKSQTQEKTQISNFQ